MTSYWVGSPKYTAGHPAPLIALVHHRMVGTLRSTDAAFTSTDGREASTHFGIGYGCGRAGHPTSAHIHQYVRLGDQAWGNGNWDPSGAWDDRYPTTLVNSRTVSIEHHDNGGRTAGSGKGVVPEAVIAASIALDALLLRGDLAELRAAGIRFRSRHRDGDHPRAPGDPDRPPPPRRPPLHRRHGSSPPAGGPGRTTTSASRRPATSPPWRQHRPLRRRP